jgi:FkbM family methyltransferase
MRLPRRTARPEPSEEAGKDGHGGPEVFGMPAREVRFRHTTFLVPEYAAQVPVARRILGRTLVSPRLHKLVRTVMEERPGSMVHAGTFFGDMLTSFSRKTPGQVYAFEAVLENYLFARATVDANDLRNVLLFHAALGETNGLVEIQTAHQRGHHRGGASYVVEGGEGGTGEGRQLVPTLTIDQFAIPDLVLVQLDVEGYEAHVLRGAEKSIAASRPVVVVEDNSRQCPDLLRGWSYTPVMTLGSDHVWAPAERADAVARLLPDAPRDDD